ncbi:MAG: tRNA lysidine(34) synthetase TilS [Candidatus Aminicenantes bacterium]|nr:tRNA lysidine(34) synthetase TilS [Candidatus Aminicenantes bacterium]
MILEKVKKTINRYHLIQRGDRILIAYSGGVDSTALLASIWKLREEWTLTLALAHFNHRLRQRADEDERFVKEVAREYDLPVYVGREDVRSYARSQSLNLEEAGRQLRYAFLEKTAQKWRASKIATGHTMTDQAETFLMRLLRGSGSRGLGGVYPLVEGRIIRPLLQVQRKEIEAYLSKQRLPYRVDESNFDRRFLRNRIRLELIPYLQKKYEPRIVDHLSRTASILQEEDDLLEKMEKEKTAKALSKKNDRLLLDRKFLFSLPLALRRRVLRHFIFKVKGDLRGISYSDIEAVLELGKGKECHLQKDFSLRNEGGYIFLTEKARPKVEFEQEWNGKGILEIKELGLRFQGKNLENDQSLPPKVDDRKQAFLDGERLQFPLLVRNRREGDKYQPLRAPGKKRLKEIMRAKGIPLSVREKKPVFLCQDDIIWVMGLPVSESYKVKKNTAVIFTIKKL